MATEHLTREYLSEWVEYKEDSKAGLVRKVPVYRGRPNSLCRSVQIEAGSDIGTVRRRKNGDIIGWYMKLNGESFAVHRALYILIYGSIPSNMVVDHIDRNPLNNKLSNLRLIPQAINCRNRKLSRKNKSGQTGVHLKDRNGLQYFVATWSFNSRPCNKKFSVLDLGYENAFYMACEFRERKIQELIELGYAYTEDHGKASCTSMQEIILKEN